VQGDLTLSFRKKNATLPGLKPEKRGALGQLAFSPL